MYTDIKTLKPNSRSGADNIPSIFYKMEEPDIRTLILEIFTLNLEAGT